MKIESKELTVRAVAEGYVDSDEEGVVGYGGKLNIRPKYQREFVYGVKERSSVMDTILKGFPLNVMYWAVNDDGTFELIDGQQRTISFCQYVNGVYSIDSRAFYNLTETEKNQILDYKLMIFFCEGNDKEKLEWFKIVNIAGMKLTDQELRNAVYTGSWLTHAKSIFSKSGCAAHQLSVNYVNGSPIRQQVLETALDWISNGEIREYMSLHQHDQNANELWTHFQNVINWITLTFTTYRKEMKGLDWGGLYRQFKDTMFDTVKLEQEIHALMTDEEVTSRKGIYPFVLTREERHLSIRTFSDNQKRAAYERQDGVCPKCGDHFALGGMEADHITPWSDGGKTTPENCQMLCRDCNRRKSNS